VPDLPIQKFFKRLIEAAPEMADRFEDQGYSTKLNLSRGALKRLPEVLGELTHLQSLDLSGNQLTNLPESCGQLDQLVYLNLSDNQLTDLPESLDHLTGLKFLCLAGNQLTNLPDAWGQLDQLDYLNLSDNQLTDLPKSLFQLSRLKFLYLSGNQLANLPESCGQLDQLDYLNFSHNRLTDLPEALFQLSRLKFLYLSENQLTTLPDLFGQLTELNYLNLSDNQLTDVPESLGQLGQLWRLYLSRNRLTRLPESLGELTHLGSLDVSGNNLTKLPESFGHLSQLDHLKLSNNRLTSLPQSFGQLTGLRSLDLSKNQLTTLPDSFGRLSPLEFLDLSDNQLTRLPESLRYLKLLRTLLLFENDPLGLPSNVVDPSQWTGKVSAPNQILEYYFQLRRGSRPLNEAKLILVGRGEVGKTSLVNRLVNNRFDKAEKKTDGIRITDWNIRLRDEESVRLNIWDFGGQEIMHATHQFFLTRRSLYILVLNGRSGGEDAEAEYWLRLVESFGGDSAVIVVLNKIREHPFDLNRPALQRKFPSIREFIKTDCEDRMGIDQLRRAIERETDRLEGLRDEFPQSWFSIKDRLAGMKENYLSFEEYRRACADFGESDKTAQEMLADRLHQLGITLNYNDDSRLQETHVLNPHWVTNGVYRILNSDKLEDQKGEIELSDLAAILDPNDYPPGMRQFLLDLMKKFDLCFNFPDRDSRYLIPELLDKQEPAGVAAFEPAKCLNFQYDYPALPEGLLPRFIVRTYVHSHGLARWRTGVVLSFEGCRALVKSDPQEKKVFISVSGPQGARRRLLAVVRSEFEKIHRSIPRLEPTEMVPIPTYPEVVVPYQKLLLMEQKEVTKFKEVVGDDLIDLDVNELLDGVDLKGARRTMKSIGDRERSIKVFISYSHKDDSLRKELETQLVLLNRLGLIETWNDRRITPGQEWEKQIDQNLSRAHIILLLISPDFMASDYCYDSEMNLALDRNQKGATVIPVIVRDVDWKLAPFRNLQVLPQDGLPVTKWPDRDSAWKAVSEGIARTVAELGKSNAQP
jgi:internalin A